MKSSNVLSNLKSNYLLRNLFDNLLKKSSLEIVKYNKNMQNRMNINIDTYKEYSQIYSSIELEIKPINNKRGVFINFDNKNKNYFHIYFDNKEETKINYVTGKEQIKTIKIIIDYKVKSFEGLFANCKCIEYVNFKKFYRNNITNMKRMFYGCS